MKIVINIPKDVIESAKSSPNYYPTYHFEKIWKAIANGTIVPKGGYEEIAEQCVKLGDLLYRLADKDD
jgi:hypothetical protein